MQLCLVNLLTLCSVAAAGFNKTCLNPISNDLQHKRMKCPKPSVAYAFLVAKGIPLWPFWKEYFSKCPPGSYTVVIHQQHLPVQKDVLKDIAGVGGGFIRPECATTGNMRFTFDMVRAQFSLYRASFFASIPPNHCRPQWVHLVSSSCLPVQPCAKFHQHLAKKPAANHLSFLKTYKKSDYKFKGHFGNILAKSDQWITLWVDDAMEISKEEDKVIASFVQKGAEWNLAKPEHDVDGGAPDEFIVPTELVRRNKTIIADSPTLIDWSSEKWRKNDDDHGSWKGHPFTGIYEDNIKYLISQARGRNSFFVRKIMMGAYAKKCVAAKKMPCT